MDKMKSETLPEQRDRFVLQREREEAGLASLVENQVHPTNVIYANPDDDEEEQQALSSDVGQDRVNLSSQDIPTKNLSTIRTTTSEGSDGKRSARKSATKKEKASAGSGDGTPAT